MGSNLIAHKVVCAPGFDEDDDGLLLEKRFDLQFLWLISIERWQPRGLSWKAIVMVEEEEDSSNANYGCTATLWLQVALVTKVQLQ
ncbi:hypothetical protein GW17_00060541 [Ensete ventricosum]|nr:hypothetical protein GW17_00060541 [Ensete ventricosum]